MRQDWVLAFEQQTDLSVSGAVPCSGWWQRSPERFVEHHGVHSSNL